MGDLGLDYALKILRPGPDRAGLRLKKYDQAGSELKFNSSRLKTFHHARVQ
jgi:hypothetical protein